MDSNTIGKEKILTNELYIQPHPRERHFHPTLIMSTPPVLSKICKPRSVSEPQSYQRNDIPTTHTCKYPLGPRPVFPQGRKYLDNPSPRSHYPGPKIDGLVVPGTGRVEALSKHMHRVSMPSCPNTEQAYLASIEEDHDGGWRVEMCRKGDKNGNLVGSISPPLRPAIQEAQFLALEEYDWEQRGSEDQVIGRVRYSTEDAYGGWEAEIGRRVDADESLVGGGGGSPTVYKSPTVDCHFWALEEYNEG